MFAFKLEVEFIDFVAMTNFSNFSSVKPGFLFLTVYLSIYQFVYLSSMYLSISIFAFWFTAYKTITLLFKKRNKIYYLSYSFSFTCFLFSKFSIEKFNFQREMTLFLVYSFHPKNLVIIINNKVLFQLIYIDKHYNR